MVRQPLLWCMLFLMLSGLVRPILAAEPLRVVAFDYPPFVMQANEQIQGFGVETLKLLNPNRPYQIFVHPLARARQELANGTFLVGMGTRLHHIESVKQGQILPVQVGSIQFVFFYARQHFSKAPQHNSLEEFRNYRICAQYDSAASQTLRAAGITFDPSSDLPSLFRKVSAGRCDLGLAIDVSITAYLLNESQPGNWGVINFPVMEVPVDFLINSQMKDAQKLAREWRMAADKFIKDGSLQKVAEKSMGGIAVPEGFLKFERRDEAP